MNVLFKKIYYKTDANCIFFIRIAALLPIVTLFYMIKKYGGVQLDSVILFFVFNVNYYYSLYLLFNIICKKMQILYQCGAGRKQIISLFVKYSLIEYLKVLIFALFIYMAIEIL